MSALRYFGSLIAGAIGILFLCYAVPYALVAAASFVVWDASIFYGASERIFTLFYLRSCCVISLMASFFFLAMEDF